MLCIDPRTICSESATSYSSSDSSPSDTSDESSSTYSIPPPPDEPYACPCSQDDLTTFQSFRVSQDAQTETELTRANTPCPADSPESVSCSSILSRHRSTASSRRSSHSSVSAKSNRSHSPELGLRSESVKCSKERKVKAWRQPPRSCEACRKKKTKCDRRMPCASCLFRNSVCEWSPAAQPVLKPINDPEEEIKRLKLVVAALATQVGVDAHQLLEAKEAGTSCSSLTSQFSLSDAPTNLPPVPVSVESVNLRLPPVAPSPYLTYQPGNNSLTMLAPDNDQTKTVWPTVLDSVSIADADPFECWLSGAAMVTAGSSNIRECSHEQVIDPAILW